jgi:hypothetical protein
LARFQIAMNDAVLVSRLERERNLSRDWALRQEERTSRDPCGEVVTLDRSITSAQTRPPSVRRPSSPWMCATLG